MDLFPNGGFVRLRSRARDKYVHADEDARGVSLRPLGAAPSVNAVWKAEHWLVGAGDAFFLLQGAAYGRYLAVSQAYRPDAPWGHRGVRAVQRDYNSPQLEAPFLWVPRRVEPGQNYVRLHNGQRCLRANGRCRYWNNVVTVDARNGDETTMMQWRVEAIPLSPEPLPLPPPPPPIHVRRGLFRRRRMLQHPGRMIWHFRLNDDGNPVSDDCPEFVSFANSVANMRAQVARREHDENITLGVRAGNTARVIPLVANLPNNVDPIQIIVYTTGSPAAAALTYPQV